MRRAVEGARAAGGEVDALCRGEREKFRAGLRLQEERYEQEIVRIEYDLLFGTKESIRTLSTSYRYTVLAFSDDRVEDLDITVYKRSGNSWEQIMKDTETDNSPLVQFTPTAATEYKVEIKAYKFREGESAAHYGLIISHDMP